MHQNHQCFLLARKAQLLVQMQTSKVRYDESHPARLERRTGLSVRPPDKLLFQDQKYTALKSQIITGYRLMAIVKGQNNLLQCLHLPLILIVKKMQ